MKKTLAAVLACVLLLTAFPAMAADNVRTSGRYTYKIKGNGTAIITSFDANGIGINEVVYIPTSLDGYTVTAIGDYAFAALKEFTIDFYLNDFDSPHYYKRPLMGRSIVIPDTVTEIGQFAFYRSNIKKVNIPTSVRSIGYGAFAGCNDGAINVDPDHPVFAVIDDALYNKQTKELLAAPVHVITIPEGIVSIGDYAFHYFERISLSTKTKDQIILPSTVTSIGNYAFAGGRRIVVLPDNLQSIGDYAFWETYGVKNAIPDSVSHLGIGAFHYTNCPDYDPTYAIKITATSNLHEIPDYAFAGCTRVKIDASNIYALGDYAFYNNKNIKGKYYLEITNSSNITRIGQWCFCSGYNGGLSLVLSDQITIIPTGFNQQVKLTDCIKRIEQNAYNSIVTDFYLPASLTYIHPEAFKEPSVLDKRDNTFVVERNSYAETWVIENGYSYTYNEEQNLDWLNN